MDNERLERVQSDIYEATALTLRTNEVGIGLYADSLPIILIALFEETEAAK